MNENLKSILLEIVQDLADLRANQAVLVARVGLELKTSLAAAQDAKKAATRQQDARYANLIQRIDSLS